MDENRQERGDRSGIDIVDKMRPYNGKHFTGLKLFFCQAVIKRDGFYAGISSPIRILGDCDRRNTRVSGREKSLWRLS